MAEFDAGATGGGGTEETTDDETTSSSTSTSTSTSNGDTSTTRTLDPTNFGSGTRTSTGGDTTTTTSNGAEEVSGDAATVEEPDSADPDTPMPDRPDDSTRSAPGGEPKRDAPTDEPLRFPGARPGRTPEETRSPGDPGQRRAPGDREEITGQPIDDRPDDSTNVVSGGLPERDRPEYGGVPVDRDTSPTRPADVTGGGDDAGAAGDGVTTVTGDQRREFAEAGPAANVRNGDVQPGFVYSEPGVTTQTTSYRPDEVELTALTGALESVEGVTGVDIVGDDPVTADAPPEEEQFGDFDWSLGLGDPEEDEVENALDDAGAAIYSGSQQTGDFLFSEEVAGESAGGALLRAAGKDELAESYSRNIRRLGGGVVMGVGALGAQATQLVTEVPEFAYFAATEPRTTAKRLPGAVGNKAALAADSGLANPAEFTGTLIGSAAISGGLFSATRGTRAGLASRVALQPGEEAVKFGIRRGFLGKRAARVTPGVRTGQAGLETSTTVETETDVDTSAGSEPLGSGGTGQVLSAEAVDEARGISGPGRLQRARGEAERALGRRPGRSAPEFVDAEQRAQVGLRPPSSETETQIDDDRVTANLYQQVVDNELRRSRRATEGGDYEGAPAPFRSETEQDRRQADFERRKQRAERQSVRFDSETETESGAEVDTASVGGATIGAVGGLLGAATRADTDTTARAIPGTDTFLGGETATDTALEVGAEVGTEIEPGFEVETEAELAAERDREIETERELELERERESEFEREREFEIEQEFAREMEPIFAPGGRSSDDDDDGFPAFEGVAEGYEVEFLNPVGDAVPTGFLGGSFN